MIDAGAGGGALTLALVPRLIAGQPRPRSFHVTAYEVDADALALLRPTLAACADLCGSHNIAFTA